VEQSGCDSQAEGGFTNVSRGEVNDQEFRASDQKFICICSAFPVENGSCRPLSLVINEASRRAWLQLSFWILAAAALSFCTRHNFAAPPAPLILSGTKSPKELLLDNCKL